MPLWKKFKKVVNINKPCFSSIIIALTLALSQRERGLF
jgi:hypothetical protein